MWNEIALFKYFAKQNKTRNLTDPTGALSRVPSSAIVSANNEVKKIASSSENSESKKRGPFRYAQLY